MPFPWMARFSRYNRNVNRSWLWFIKKISFCVENGKIHKFSLKLNMDVNKNKTRFICLKINQVGFFSKYIIANLEQKFFQQEINRL